MKRVLLAFIILLSFGTARASDTLTIRQVYNFDVGDTFVYHIESYGPLYSNPHVSFYTVAITGRWYSPALDTVYYARTKDNIPDTIHYTHLDDFLYLTDTPQAFCPCFRMFTVDTVCGGTRNSIFWSNGGDFFVTDFIAGLGRTLGGVGKDDGRETDTALNSYSKVDGRVGQTPYYLTAIDEIGTAAEGIRVYPLPTSGMLHFVFPDAARRECTLSISDLLGREVYTSPLSQAQTTHDISYLSSGIYTWRLMTNSSIIKTGKVVKD